MVLYILPRQYSLSFNMEIIKYWEILYILSDFRFAGEGAEYAGYIVDIVTPSFFIQILLFLVVGILEIIFIPVHKKLNKKFQIILFISVFWGVGEQG